jgi:hypothetical protein
MSAARQIPLPPGTDAHMSIGGTLGDAAAVIIVLAVLGTALALVWPLIRALARRLEGGAAAAALKEEMDGLRQRMDRLEAGQERLAELEERLDFAERLLAQSREPDRLER